jgi:acyl-CoA reductase-like NAD-dependent aldehyde dehydrogenase
LCGGKAQGGTEGYFYEPTIVSGIKEGVKLWDEEQFGPVLPITPYSDDDEAVQRANASEMGLGGSVWSSDPSAAADLAARLEAGTVWVNQHTDLTGAPFGGFKHSGIGRELGNADISTFTESQTLSLAK